MSSTADSVKTTNTQNSEPAEEPSAKKVKLADLKDEHSDKDLANNNGTNANNNADPKGPSGSGTAVPTKVANGKSTTIELQARDPNGSEIDDEELDPEIASKFREIEQIQADIVKLNEQASEEILKVEQKFNKLRRPHFEKRNTLLKDIPNFWLTTLSNHPIIQPMIENPADEACLNYLIDLDVQEFEDIKSGYKLKFHFTENPYFQNDLIVRDICHTNSDEIESKATKVEYKDTNDANLLKQTVQHSTNEYRRLGRPNQQHLSFFAWLSQPCETSSDDIAEIIKDQIWPSPLEFFFNSQPEYSDESDEDEEDDDEDDYDEEGEAGEEVLDEDIDTSDDDQSNEELDDEGDCEEIEE